MKYSTLSLRTRIVLLGKKNRDVIAELRNRGIECNDSKFSSAISGANVEPVCLQIKEIATKIIEEWESKMK